MRSDRVLDLARFYFGDDTWPEQLRFLEAARRLVEGEPRQDVQRAVRTTKAKIEELALSPDPVMTALGFNPETVTDDHLARARRTLGQQVLGLCGELAFEAAYKEAMHTQELRLDDQRHDHSDTDYRLVNGGGRPLYRINIKTHASRFRRAKEMVGLEPDDCFALATYKIHGALLKQDEERLPYIFAIVGIPGLSGEIVGAGVSDDLVEFMAVLNAAPLVQRTRKIEDFLVMRMAKEGWEPFPEVYAKFAQEPWYLLSARRAYGLLRDRLFERVFALRERGFAQNFRGAELDMHFSISQELTLMSDFLDDLKAHGLTKVAIKLDRGDY